MTINEDAFDAITGHRLNLLRYEAGTAEALVTAYDDALSGVTDELKAIDAIVKEGGIVSELRRTRLRAVAADLTRRIRDLNRLLNVSLGERLAEAAQAEQAFLTGPFSRTIGLSMSAPPEGSVILAINAPLGGSRWTDRLAVDLMEATQGIQGAIGSGFASGASMPEIARAIGKATGLTEHYRGRLIAIARTEVQRVANDVAMATYMENDDVVGAVQWLATLDTRTCLVCAPLHNTVYPLVNGRAVGLDRRPPIHPRDRCFMAPIIKSYADIGVPVKGSPKGYDGKPALDTTFEDWLKRQSEDRQIDFLGEARHKLWITGKVGLEGFSDAGRVLRIGELMATVNS